MIGKCAVLCSDRTVFTWHVKILAATRQWHMTRRMMITGCLSVGCLPGRGDRRVCVTWSYERRSYSVDQSADYSSSAT